MASLFLCLFFFSQRNTRSFTQQRFAAAFELSSFAAFELSSFGLACERLLAAAAAAEGACWQRVAVHVAVAAAGGSAETAEAAFALRFFFPFFQNTQFYAAPELCCFGLACASGFWRRQQWLDACRWCMALDVAAAATAQLKLHGAVAFALPAGFLLVLFCVCGHFK